ncbi:MAG: DUF998 domain-containing protein [Lysobacter sp.]|nr:DUF998 domain-containing protein [Lysobacter sp.]
MTEPSTSPARPTSSRPPSTRLPSTRVLSTLALLGFVASLLGFGAMLDGFSQGTHPVALLGARGVPRWWAFDLFGFVLPGLLAWASIVRSSIADNARADGGGRLLGVGWTLCAIAALAFAAQGALPIDAAQGFGYGIARLHAAAWTVWWIAFAAGGVLLAIGWRGRIALRFATAFVVALVLVFSFVAVPGAPAMGQRIGFVAWLAWVACVGWGFWMPRERV